MLIATDLAVSWLLRTFMASTSQDCQLQNQYKCSLTAGPYHPVLSFPKRSFGKQKRNFIASWYSRYPWLHYVQETDSVICFDCTAASEGKFPISGYIDKVFTETGFNNWQNALKKFNKHQQSQSHKFAVDLIMRERRKAKDA